MLQIKFHGPRHEISLISCLRNQNSLSLSHLSLSLQLTEIRESNMTSQKNPAAFVLALLLLTSTSHVDISRGAEARPLTITKQQKYVKVLESLGLMCQCCDGDGGDCRSTWDSNCAKLDCRPWKFS